MHKVVRKVVDSSYPFATLEVVEDKEINGEETYVFPIDFSSKEEAEKYKREMDWFPQAERPWGP